MAQHGWNWGDKAYKTVPAATFTGDGADKLLHVQGYDIDYADEVGVWLNGTLIGYLSQGYAAITVNDGWGVTQPIVLPAGMRSLVEVDNTYNPPKSYSWGVRIDGLE